MKSAFYRLPIFLLAFSIIFVSGYSELRAFEKYKSGLVKSALEKGQTVFIEYYAPWCPVCKTQARVMKDLLSNNPEYSESMRFVRVSWDKYKNSEISKKYRVRRQATLVLVKGKRVLGKLVAKTSKSSIERLMKKGV